LLVYDEFSSMIERTVLEIQQHRFWAWQRQRSLTPRNQLRETDLLMNVVEECRIRRLPLIPTAIWRRIVHLLGQVGGDYTARLGIDRSVDRTGELLFEAQAALMAAEVERRKPRRDKIIPLFR
jgi:hypothetical protein